MVLTIFIGAVLCVFGCTCHRSYVPAVSDFVERVWLDINERSVGDLAN